MEKYGVLNFIGKGEENATTRETLCAKTGLTDRHIREHIEQLRKEGYFILSDNKGKGYYRCDVYDIPSLLEYYWSEWRRAISILVRLKFLRKWLAENGCDMNPNHLKKVVVDDGNE